MRAYELARELGVSSKELMERCQKLDLTVKSHASSLTAQQVTELRAVGTQDKDAPGKAVGKVAVKKKVAGKKKAAKKTVKKKVTKKVAAKKTAAVKKKVTKKAVSGKKSPPASKATKVRFRKGAIKKRVLRITRHKRPVSGELKDDKVEEKVAKPVGTATWTGELKTLPIKKKTQPSVEEEQPEKKTDGKTIADKSKRKKHEPTVAKRESKVKVIFRPDEGKEAPVSRGRIKGHGRVAVGRIDLESEQAKARKKRLTTKGRGEWRTGAMRALTDDADDGGRGRRRGGVRRVKFRSAAVLKPKPTEAELVTPVTIKDFSGALAIRASKIIGKLMSAGVMANINQVLSEDMVMHLAEELGVKVTLKAPKDISAEFLREQQERQDNPEDMELKAPVVTFMGHVDHGKTSLLDAIRKENVVSTESGGITQHIGAYRVVTPEGRAVVFLDTPGHEAFTEMRARGANVTDVVVLVVAADDGVMPQTEEAINHARAAGVPIVVAINKVDRPNANIDRTKQQLANMDLQSEDWGGQTVVVETSAMTKQGLNELVEMLSLEAELLELKANKNRPAQGVVIEARLSEGRGTTATVLIQTGTLKVGQVVLCGLTYGRVRAMYDDSGQSISEAGPATPVTLLGLSSVPETGDELFAMDDLSHARQIAETRARKSRQARMTEHEPVTLENLFAHIESGRIKELRVILKADVKGSIEVLRSSIEKISTAEVKVHVLHSAVGGVNESDVLLANASNAIVIGFHVAPDERARLLALEKSVEIRLYQVIYKVTEEMRDALEGLLDPELREVADGHVEVRQVFKVSRLGSIAGCFVTDGLIKRSSKIRLYRDNVQIYEGKLESLRRFKDDAREVRSGLECGIRVANFDDVKVGDTLEAYHVEEIARKLE